MLEMLFCRNARRSREMPAMSIDFRWMRPVRLTFEHEEKKFSCAAAIQTCTDNAVEELPMKHVGSLQAQCEQL